MPVHRVYHWLPALLNLTTAVWAAWPVALTIELSPAGRKQSQVQIQAMLCRGSFLGSCQALCLPLICVLQLPVFHNLHAAYSNHGEGAPRSSRGHCPLQAGRALCRTRLEEANGASPHSPCYCPIAQAASQARRPLA